jgi:hypothetical protein
MKKYLFAILIALVFVISQSLLVFILLAMSPTILIAFLEYQEQKFKAHTVGMFNLTGLIPFLFHIFNINTVNEYSSTYMKDLFVWFVIYGCTGLGYLAYYAIPSLYTRFILSTVLIRKQHLHEKQQKLKEEWGPNVALK